MVKESQGAKLGLDHLALRMHAQFAPIMVMRYADLGSALNGYCAFVRMQRGRALCQRRKGACKGGQGTPAR
jgi:hypothetical protein